MSANLNCVFLGLSVTSTWGNGHATTYRGLLKELHARGHNVTFLERDVPWYSSNREFDSAPYCSIHLYTSLDELKERFTQLVRSADVVVVGSYVPEGVAVGHWVTATAQGCPAFYDIDTPVTLTSLKDNRCDYISYDLYRKYKVYFSFTGGPTLTYVEKKLGSPHAEPLYCSVDPDLYFPESAPKLWDLGYIGTYAPDRQPALDMLLIEAAHALPACRFCIAGPQYPESISWPSNVERIEHLPASGHRHFYNSQRFTLNVTRRDMVRAGYSPSVRLFEAAACGVPIVTDEWRGLETFFKFGTEILPVRTTADVASYLQTPEEQRLEIAERARRRTLRFHTAAVRAEEFETCIYSELERAAMKKKRNRAGIRQSPTAASL